MNVEIITIGNEILSGETIDTNSSHIAKTLLNSGAEVTRITTVGDNEEEIISAVESSLNRADVVIATGGLGPTQDDLTLESVAKLYKKDLVLDEEVLNTLREKFRRFGYKKMPEQNIKQAMMPEEAEVIENNWGTAPGIMLTGKGKATLFLLPGVPYEVRKMLENAILPFVESKIKGKVVVSRTIRTSGIGESALAELVEPILKDVDDVIFASLPGLGRVDLKLTCKSNDEEYAKRRVKEAVNYIVPSIEKWIYGFDGDTLEGKIIEMMNERKQSLAIAESCTGGLISDRLTNVPGCSEVLIMAAVTYSNKSKIQLLNVDRSILEKYGAVSEQTAHEMAVGVRKLADTDFGLSVTGIAGPTGGTEEKPVGLVYIGVDHKEGTDVKKYTLPGSRRIIKERSAQLALTLLWKYLRRT